MALLRDHSAQSMTRGESFWLECKNSSVPKLSSSYRKAIETYFAKTVPPIVATR